MSPDSDDPVPADLPVFRHATAAVVEEMGLTLQRTAYSTNVKTRRDHTCAMFDADLRHVAQHDVAPQHVGSMVSAVPRNLGPRLEECRPGDGFLLNDPYRGAVHLPDVMLLTPVFADPDAEDPELLGAVANSAHHVDVGGATAGGIPVETELYAEGLVLPCVRAVEDWTYDEEVMALVTRNVRDPDRRRGDYRAQLGANRTGARRYRDLLARYGREGLRERTEALFDYTERRVRAAVADLPDGEYRASEAMDGDGVVDEPVRLELAVVIDGERLVVDFAGTDQQCRGPLNCTPAMAFAGVVSVLMGFLGPDLPKNDGFYRPIEVQTPSGSVVDPDPQAPVAGGWEVAMRAGELVAAAMADPAPEATLAGSKGTVCNVAYSGRDPRSGEEYVFYETVAGGMGARADRDGLDAVQTGFQNTANAPIEELEREVPLYVRRYELRPDSAGAGRRRGGAGVRREVEFYDHEATLSLLADRTRTPPRGLFGGLPGAPARYALDPESRDETLPSKVTTDLDPGTTVSVQTPGGGGYGDPGDRERERVLADVRAGLVAPASARETYGVDPAGTEADPGRPGDGTEAATDREPESDADERPGEGQR
jgi:N-methylhydantoinase B